MIFLTFAGETTIFEHVFRILYTFSTMAMLVMIFVIYGLITELSRTVNLLKGWIYFSMIIRRYLSKYNFLTNIDIIIIVVIYFFLLCMNDNSLATCN